MFQKFIFLLTTNKMFYSIKSDIITFKHKYFTTLPSLLILNLYVLNRNINLD